MRVSLVEATVTQVESVGMGDRVCVDLCNLSNPGEGLLEPVHAYVTKAGGRTAYLSELHSGSQVLVVDAMGHSRTVLVGRVKIESRILLLVEVDEDGQKPSVLLQNAEAVCLVAPGDEKVATPLPVTSLKLGDRLLLSSQ